MNTSESVLTRWMNLETFIQSEVRKKQISYINVYVWNLEMVLMNICRAAVGIENKLMDMAGGRKERLGQMERVEWKLTLLYVK